MILPPIRDGLLKLKLMIAVHQKLSETYSAELTFNNITVPLDVIKKDKVLETDPAVIFEVRSKRGLNRLIKFEFDETTAVYNK